MKDPRALRNSRNLSSWRAWEQEAYRRSGFTAIFAGVCSLAVGFVLACTLYRGPVAFVVLAFGAYLAAVFGLMVFAVLRLNAWKRAHPWTPPSGSPSWVGNSVTA